ncbi:MAG: hypothetical protein IEMM0006_1625 [bacterium]|nr:MAG: hypothetical protein IEMM0006_1625 [bacterium]
MDKLYSRFLCLNSGKPERLNSLLLHNEKILKMATEFVGLENHRRSSGRAQ